MYQNSHNVYLSSKIEIVFSSNSGRDDVDGE